MRKQDRPPIPAERSVRPRVIRVPKDGEIAVLWMEGLQGVLTHYVRKNAVPCLGETRCPPKRHEVRLDWKGYAAAFWKPPSGDVQIWTPCVFELTAQAAALMGTEPIRGVVFYFRRKVDREGKQEIQVKRSHSLDGVAVPKPFPIRPILERVFGTQDFTLGAPNPIESLPLVEPFNPLAPAEEAETVVELDAEEAAAIARLRGLRDGGTVDAK